MTQPLTFGEENQREYAILLGPIILHYFLFIEKIAFSAACMSNSYQEHIRSCDYEDNINSFAAVMSTSKNKRLLKAKTLVATDSFFKSIPASSRSSKKSKAEFEESSMQTVC